MAPTRQSQSTPELSESSILESSASESNIPDQSITQDNLPESSTLEEYAEVPPERLPFTVNGTDANEITRLFAPFMEETEFLVDARTLSLNGKELAVGFLTKQVYADTRDLQLSRFMVFSKGVNNQYSYAFESAVPPNPDYPNYFPVYQYGEELRIVNASENWNYLDYQTVTLESGEQICGVTVLEAVGSMHNHFLHVVFSAEKQNKQRYTVNDIAIEFLPEAHIYQHYLSDEDDCDFKAISPIKIKIGKRIFIVNEANPRAYHLETGNGIESIGNMKPTFAWVQIGENAKAIIIRETFWYGEHCSRIIPIEVLPK